MSKKEKKAEAAVDGGAETAAEVPALAGEVRQIKLTELSASPYQTRRPDLKSPDMKELAQNIRECGVIQPIIVRANPGAKGWKSWEIICGHRRAQAAAVAGLKTIPALVVEKTDAEAAELCVAENIQRAGLTPFEEARTVSALVKVGRSDADISARLGKSPHWVAVRKAICEIPEDLAIRFETGDLQAWEIAAVEIVGQTCKANGADVAKQMIVAVTRHAEESPNVGDLRVWLADNVERDLDGAGFGKEQRTACTACLKRTGAYGDLFGECPKGKLGQCLDKDCFEKMRRASKLAKVAEGVRKAAKLLPDGDTGVLVVSKVWDRDLNLKKAEGIMGGPVVNSGDIYKEVPKPKKGFEPAVIVEGYSDNPDYRIAYVKLAPKKEEDPKPEEETPGEKLERIAAEKLPEVLKDAVERVDAVGVEAVADTSCALEAVRESDKDAYAYLIGKAGRKVSDVARKDYALSLYEECDQSWRIAEENDRAKAQAVFLKRAFGLDLDALKKIAKAKAKEEIDDEEDAAKRRGEKDDEEEAGPEPDNG